MQNHISRGFSRWILYSFLLFSSIPIMAQDYTIGFFWSWLDDDDPPPALLWEQLDSLNCNYAMIGRYSDPADANAMLADAATNNIDVQTQWGNAGTDGPHELSFNAERMLYFSSTWNPLEITEISRDFFNTNTTGVSVDDVLLVTSNETEVASNFRRKVIQCNTSLHGEGYLASNVSDEWRLQQTRNGNSYYAKPRLRIPVGTSTTLSKELIRVEVWNKSVTPNTLITDKIYYTTDFDGKNLNFYHELPGVSFTLPTAPSPPPPPSSKTLSEALDQIDAAEIEYKVYWYDEVSIWFDYLKVDSQIAQDLFAKNKNSDLYNDASDISGSALKRYVLKDEPRYSQFRSNGYISNFLDDTLGIPGYSTLVFRDVNIAKDSRYAKDFALLQEQPELVLDGYPITFQVPIPDAYNGLRPGTEYLGSGGYTSNESEYNDELQRLMGLNLLVPLDSVRSAALKFNRPFWFIPQLHGYATYNGSIVVPQIRNPTPEEIEGMVYTALTFGAKGIFYFMYHDIVDENGFLITGMVDKTSTKELTHNTETSNPVNTTIWADTVYSGHTTKWNTVIALNERIKIIYETLDGLETVDVFDDQNLAGNGLVSSIDYSQSSAAIDGYLTFGTFETASNGDDYFMVVNRQCHPDAEQTIVLSLTSSSALRVIEDVLGSRYPDGTHSFTTLDPGETDVTITLEPGEGKLFRITDGVNGELPAENYYLSGEVYLSGDLLVADGEKLIIEPATLVGAAKTTSTTNYGIYSSKPEIVAEFDARLDIQNATLKRHNNGINSWGGILISSGLGSPPATPNSGPDAHIKIQQSVIEDAEIGIYISSSGADEKTYDLSNNTIEDCDIGIKVLNLEEDPVELDITSNTIKNCDIGIEMQGSEGAIVNNTIYAGDFGITCSISSGPRIKGNAVHTIAESGLYCVNNSSPLVHTKTANPSEGGGENSFHDCDNGVLAENNSFPKLGEISLDHSNDGKNYIFDNVVDVNNNTGTLLAINAIYNYWSNVSGASVPPDSVRGLVSYSPWLQVPDPTSKDGEQNKYSASDSLYLAGLDEEKAGNLTSALSTYHSIISIYPDSRTSQTAISGVVRILKQDDKLGQIMPELNAIISTHDTLAAADYARQQFIPLLASEQSFTEATTHLNYLLAKYSGTDFEQYVLFDQLFLAESQAGGSQGKNTFTSIYAALEEKVSALEESPLKRYLAIKMAVQNSSTESEQVSETIFLARNYPNPFNPETTIEYQMPSDERVKIEVFNLLGQRIRTLVDGPRSSGIHKVRWDGRNASGESVASGIYIYFIRAGKHNKTGKMILLK